MPLSAVNLNIFIPATRYTTGLIPPTNGVCKTIRQLSIIFIPTNRYTATCSLTSSPRQPDTGPPGSSSSLRPTLTRNSTSSLSLQLDSVPPFIGLSSVGGIEAFAGAVANSVAVLIQSMTANQNSSRDVANSNPLLNVDTSNITSGRRESRDLQTRRRNHDQEEEWQRSNSEPVNTIRGSSSTYELASGIR